jgi:hypothetical protein
LTSLYQTVTETKPYNKADAEFYYYISESGSPMIGDVSFLVHSVQEYEASCELARQLGFPVKLNMREPHKFRRAFLNYRNAILKYTTIEGERKIKETSDYRLFLGSSSKPVLNKKRYIQELNQGNSDEIIKQNYRGWDNKPLSQWKAHHTMGTYNNSVKPVVVPTVDIGTNSELSKKDALMMLQSNIPINEIVDAFPNSYSKGQLRAMKAHITMGTYAHSN